MLDPVSVDAFLWPAVVMGAAAALVFMARVMWRDWRDLQRLRLREKLLPKRRLASRVPPVSDDAEDTRRLIAEARRVKEEFDRVERLHDILAKQRLGRY